MANLIFIGHKTRGKELHKLLERLGGIDAGYVQCSCVTGYYYINREGYIEGSTAIPLYMEMEKRVIMTLEEFERKYPYKVGDKVRIPNYESEIRISGIHWDGYNVQYEIVTDEVEWYSTEELNNFNEPRKEETMDKVSKSVFDANAQCCYISNKIIKKETMEKEILTIDFTKDQKIADKVEVILGDYEFVLKDGKTYFIKKQPKYPKTYEECCKVLGINELPYMVYTWNRNEDVEVILQEHQISTILNLDRFRKLLVCRDAYWKLERDWKPDWLYDDTKYILHINSLDICKDMSKHSNYILAFPTEEMRDAFYENFKELIEECKELL